MSDVVVEANVAGRGCFGLRRDDGCLSEQRSPFEKSGMRGKRWGPDVEGQSREEA